MRKYPHFEDCRCGKGGKKLSPPSNNSPGDEWYVNAPEYDNCFWTYLRHNNRVHGLAEIASLIGVSISAITAIERRAVKKLKKRLKKYINK